MSWSRFTEAFYIRSVLAYAVGGGVVGLACYLGLIPFDPATLSFDGIVRRNHRNHDGGGHRRRHDLLDDRGRNAGACANRRAVDAAATACRRIHRRRRKESGTDDLFIPNPLG